MLRMLPDLQERTDLILSFARVLHVNGQSTDETLAACERLGSSLGLRAKIIPAWGQLHLQAGDLETISTVTAAPIGVDMHRVASAMHFKDEVSEGQLTPSASRVTIKAISQAPPAPTWLFTLAAAAGAAALSVVFGVQHSVSVVIIATSAAVGAVLRHTLAHHISNPPAAVLRRPGRGPDWRIGGSLSVEFITASDSRLPVYDPGSGAAYSERNDGSCCFASGSWCFASDLCCANNPGDLCRTARRT